MIRIKWQVIWNVTANLEKKNDFSSKFTSWKTKFFISMGNRFVWLIVDWRQKKSRMYSIWWVFNGCISKNLTSYATLTYAIDRNATKKVFSAVAWTNVIQCQIIVTLHACTLNSMRTHTCTTNHMWAMLSTSWP